jgi:hypothetical protein
VAEEELQVFGSERRAAPLLQAGAIVVGAFLPLIAGVFYLAVSVIFIAEQIRRMRIRARRDTQPG